jgi:hypothetical protein
MSNSIIHMLWIFDCLDVHNSQIACNYPLNCRHKAQLISPYKLHINCSYLYKHKRFLSLSVVLSSLCGTSRNISWIITLLKTNHKIQNVVRTLQSKDLLTDVHTESVQHLISMAYKYQILPHKTLHKNVLLVEFLPPFHSKPNVFGLLHTCIWMLWQKIWQQFEYFTYEFGEC